MTCFNDRLFNFNGTFRQVFHTQCSQWANFARGPTNLDLSARSNGGVNAQAGGSCPFFLAAANRIHVLERGTVSQVSNDSYLFNCLRGLFQFRVEHVFQEVKGAVDLFNVARVRNAPVCPNMSDRYNGVRCPTNARGARNCFTAVHGWCLFCRAVFSSTLG